MLAVHWTPVNNTKHILKHGISQSKKGVFCFPLTGHYALDRWWIQFFNQTGNRPRKKYNGIVFRIRQQDLPAYLGPWMCATNRDDFKKEISDLQQLGKAYRDILLWRMGEQIAFRSTPIQSAAQWSALSEQYISMAEAELRKDAKALSAWMTSIEDIGFALEDYQIVLSNSIPSSSILKVLPQGNEFGRILKQHKSTRMKYGIKKLC